MGGMERISILAIVAIGMGIWIMKTVNDMDKENGVPKDKTSRKLYGIFILTLIVAGMLNIDFAEILNFRG